jgi:hypothetical protein
VREPSNLDKDNNKPLKENWAQRLVSRFLKSIIVPSKKTGEKYE